MNNNPQDSNTAFRPIDDKTAFRAMKDFEKFADRAAREMDKELKRLERQNELEQRNKIIENMTRLMRDNGASDRSIQKALPGLAELAKYAIRTNSSPASGKSEHPQSAPPSNEEALGLLLSEIEAREIHWLWEKRIPLGKITILDGDPGMGKSLLAIQIAACVTTGHPMPDGTPGTQGGVVLIAPEDGASDTLRPRLKAADGDPSHVLLLNTVESLDAKKMKMNDRPFSLSQDLEVLEEAIKRTNAALVILDPLTAVLGHRLHASRDQDVREIFTPLAQLAERTNCAVLVIRHLSKAASVNALYRGAGSIGIIAAARTGLIVAQHPYEENSRILATSKNNLSKKVNNLTYQIIENESGIPYIQWLGENNFTLPTLLGGGTNLSIKRHNILQVLKDADGPLELQEVAELTGQTYTSVRRTLSRMYKAREIIRLNRGLYTTLDHPSLLQQGNIAKTGETSETSETSETLAISAQNTTTHIPSSPNNANPQWPAASPHPH
jgi:archaellum biogenesis ATPase FlaH